jgi:twinkle protein
MKEGKQGVIKTFYSAKKYRPDGIINAKDIDFNVLISDEDIQAFSLPYAGVNRKTAGGFEKGRLAVVTAGTGIGKSTFTREVAYHFAMKHKLKVGFIALEENNKRTALGFMGIYLNKPIHIRPVLKRIKETEPEKLKEAYDKVIQQGNFFLYDHFGSLESDNLLEKIRYLAVAEQVDFIFLDHISIVISGDDITGSDERKAIDVLMTKLRSLAEETGVGIIVVSHLRRPQGHKGFEDGLQITLNHLRGSGAIAQLADYVIGLERNQQGDNPNEAIVRILKNRVTGETGQSDVLLYDPDTGRLLPTDDEVYEIEEEEGFTNEADEW